MPLSFRKNILVAIAGLLLILPFLWLFLAEQQSPDSQPADVLQKYLKAVYARDFRQAYRFISSQDKKLKQETVYIRERGPFLGFTAELAQRLADLIEIQPIQRRQVANRALIKLSLKLPDANSVAPLVMEWDEERLNALSRNEQQRILAAIERLIKNNSLKEIEGEEEFAMVREGTTWKVFLDWAAGIKVAFNATVPSGDFIQAQAVIKETVARPGELFTIAYRVQNYSRQDLVTRIIHHVEPKELSEYLDLVECALLLPVRLLPGEQREYASTYLVRGDLPEGFKALNVTYEFTLDR